MLALPPSQEDLLEPLILHSVDIRRKIIEPAGRAFHEYALRINFPNEKQEEEEEEDSGEESKIDMEKMKNKRRKRSWIQTGEESFYDILSLPSKIEVTNEMIKDSYKKLALIHHPDKKVEYGDKEKEVWLKVSLKDKRGLRDAD